MKRPPRHLLVAASGWLGRVLSLGLSILNLRLLNDRLSTDDFGAYVLVANLLPWFALGDLGVGAALQNELGKARAQGRSDAPVVASAILAVLGATLTLGTALALLAGFLGRLYLGRFVADAAGPFLVGSALLCVGVLGLLAQRIWYGQERGHWANATLVAAAALTTLSLARLRPEAELSSALLAGLGPTAALGLVSLGLTAPRAPSLYVEAVRRGGLGQLLRKSGGFLALAVMANLVLNLDYLVVSRFLSSQDAIVYSIGARVFDLFGLLHSTLLLAYWPAAAEALARGEVRQVRRRATLYAAIAIGGVLLGGLACALSRHLLLRLLAPGRQGLVLGLGLIAALTLVTVARVWTNTNAIVVQALGRVRLLLWVTPTQAVVNLGLLALLVPALGLAGIPLALALSYAGTAAWILPVYLRRVERGGSGRGLPAGAVAQARVEPPERRGQEHRD